MTILSIHPSILQLVISCGDGKRDDDEVNGSGCELCERRRARPCDGYICSVEDVWDIRLRNPVEHLGIFPLFELRSHILVQCSETNYPFTVEKPSPTTLLLPKEKGGLIFFPIQKRLKNLPRSLASAAYEYMLFLSLPFDVSSWIFCKEIRMEDLSDNRCFMCREPFSGFLESEEYPCREVSEHFVGKPGNRVGFVDIERYPEDPCGDPDCDRTGSTLGEHEFRLFSFQDFSCFQYPLQKFERIEKNPERSRARELVGGYWDEPDTRLLRFSLLHTRFSSNPKKLF